jgi:hypothetical protein
MYSLVGPLKKYKLCDSKQYSIVCVCKQLVAAQLHIPGENVFANTLLFGDDGEFKGFGKTEPTS